MRVVLYKKYLSRLHMKNYIYILLSILLVLILLHSLCFCEGMENMTDESTPSTNESDMVNFCEDEIRNDINDIRKSLDKKSLQKKTLDQIQEALKKYENIQKQMNKYIQLSQENTQRINDIERQCKE